MKKSMSFYILLFLFLITAGAGADLNRSDPHTAQRNRNPDSIKPRDTIVVYGEYPVVEELGAGSFGGGVVPATKPLIDYRAEVGVAQRALIEALHLLNANVYGYTFFYKPGSKLLETEEVFTLELKGELDRASVRPIAEGVFDSVYRVKIEFRVTPSLRKWMNAFTSHTLRLENAEGTSEFFTGWEGRSVAFREALRNLVLVTAKKRLSSKPLVMEGDILLSGNPTFSVGAGRHYCRVEGWVNIVEVVTYD